MPRSPGSGPGGDLNAVMRADASAGRPADLNVASVRSADAGLAGFAKPTPTLLRLHDPFAHLRMHVSRGLMVGEIRRASGRGTSESQ